MGHIPITPATTPTCAGSPVSWQVAFWSLVPTALNTMTQSSGRVCGLSAQFRTYLRVSPIFCLLDTVVLLIRLGIYRISGLPWRLAAREVKNARFDEEEVQAAEFGFQALEKLTFVRWLLFLLGAVPQTIKLAALRNVPWTKMWGCSLFASFVVLEIVLGMLPAELRTGSPSESQGMVHVDGHAGDASESQATEILDPPMAKVRRMKHSLAIMDGIAAVLATFLHNVLLLWVLHQLWRHGFDFTGSISSETWSWRAVFHLPVLAFYTCILTAGVSLVFFLPAITLLIILMERLPPRMTILAALPVLGGLVLILFVAARGMDFVYKHIEPISGWTYEIATLAIVLSLLNRICWGLFASQPLRLKLGLLGGRREYWPPPNHELEAKTNEKIAVGAFLGFVATIVLCLSWYQVKYDPAGTCQPSLTNVFG